MLPLLPGGINLTVSGVSGSGVESSCLGRARINDETGTESGGDTVDASVVANTVVGV